MRWTLPGGAELAETGDERALACRPLAGVSERVRPREVVTPVEPHPIDPPPKKPSGWLARAKLVLEVLALLVGLIGSVLALLGVSRK